MTIKYKGTVNVVGVREEILSILPIIERCFQDSGCNDFTITCTVGDHAKDDPHSNGFAIDIRLHDYGIDLQNNLFNRVNTTLSGLYYVKLEDVGKMNAHLHIQVYKGIWQSILDRERLKRNT
jgi:hypothetical protein